MAGWTKGSAIVDPRARARVRTRVQAAISIHGSHSSRVRPHHNEGTLASARLDRFNALDLCQWLRQGLKPDAFVEPGVTHQGVHFGGGIEGCLPVEDSLRLGPRETVFVSPVMREKRLRSFRLPHSKVWRIGCHSPHGAPWSSSAGTTMTSQAACRCTALAVEPRSSPIPLCPWLPTTMRSAPLASA